jgi:hypothetical protein
MKALLIVISLLFLTDTSRMHQDTPLQIDKNGNIIGLPKEFRPAKFDLEKKYLRLNDKEIVFPACLNKYFNEYEKPKLNLSSSWYHSKDVMPYYLNFDVSQKNVNYGYTILVDLETLELIYVRKSIKKGNTVYSPEIELEKQCLDEYKNSIKILK